MPARRRRPHAWRPGAVVIAALAYTAIALAYTWPLATGLTTDVPWDLGDALLNDWILAWHYHQAGRLLSGDWSAFADWWHPPIFHPARYTIAYSELLVTQAVLGAPVYALTGNLLLTYNVLFIASFALSGIGTFLLVRELTGDARAGWVAGLLYGFALYRVAQAPHLQVLHAQWAPLVLYGLHRWFATGRWRTAVGAGVALAAQNLSNGYYLFYMALLLPPYVVAQMATRGRLRDPRAWAGPTVAAVVAAVLTVPLMYPYVRLRALGEGGRPLAAVAHYGADTLAWLTAPELVHVWGWLRPMPRAEGELFPGLVTAGLAAAGLVLVAAGRLRGPRPDGEGRVSAGAPERTATVGSPGASRRRRVGRWLALTAAVAVALLTLAIGLVLLTRNTRVALGPVAVSLTDGRRLLLQWVAGVVLLLAASGRARRVLRDTPAAPVVTLAGLTVLTVWLSLGPMIRIGGRPAPTWPEAYSLVYDGLPGGDALRVPPRIAMMTALLLAMLGGVGVAALRARHRVPDLGVAALSIAFLAEAWVAPIPRNLTIDAGQGLAPVPADVPPRPALHPEAITIDSLPVDAVLVELPIGSLPYEIRWQYLQAGHWRARVNGYSGGFPAAWLQVEQALSALPDRGAAAMALLEARGVTHVVLHPGAWADPAQPAAIRGWLTAEGAAPVVHSGSMEVWALPE